MNNKISIILPCYNVEKYIRRCYESCIEQDYSDFEIIFVDDASKDNTVKIISEISSIDDRVSLVSLKENRGTFHARKIGFEKSSGSYIFFLDPDDEIEKNCLKKLVKTIVDSNSDIVYFSLKVLPSNKLTKEISIPSYASGIDIFETVIKKSDSIPKGNPGKFYKRHVIEGAFDSLSFIENRFVYAEDVVLFFATLNCAESIIGLKEKLYIYHNNIESITKVIDVNKIEYNICQIEYAIDSINKIETTDNIIISECKNILINSLKYDIINLKRKISSFENNKKRYFLLSIDMLKEKFYFRNLIKLLIFIFSFGKCKLF